MKVKMTEKQGKYNTTRKQYERNLVYTIKHEKYSTKKQKKHKNITQKFHT